MYEYHCDGCGKQIKKRQRYCLHIELFAAPEVEIEAEDLYRNHQREIQELYRQMEKEDPKKLEEDVYVCYDLNLCKKCRDRFSQRIKCKEFV